MEEGKEDGKEDGKGGRICVEMEEHIPKPG
jgi:hypothetical protein